MVTEPDQSEDEAVPRTISMTWGEVCDTEVGMACIHRAEKTPSQQYVGTRCLAARRAITILASLFHEMRVVDQSRLNFALDVHMDFLYRSRVHIIMVVALYLHNVRSPSTHQYFANVTLYHICSTGTRFAGCRRDVERFN